MLKFLYSYIDKGAFMRHSELKNFTHKQLSAFKNQELSLDKYELIAKAENASIELPDDVKNKLYELCTELKKQSPENSKIFSVNLKTVGDLAKILSCLITTVKNLNDLEFDILLKECLDHIIYFLNNRP